jgi:hypothetical protein
VSEDIADEVLDQAYDADEVLTNRTKSFIDLYVTPGERSGEDRPVRKKA